MIKNINFYLIPIFLLLMISSCKDDIIGDENPTVITTVDPIISVASSVIGSVTNKAGDALAGVTVTHRGDIYTTDANGYFKFGSTTAVVNGGYLSFQKTGYFDNYKFYYPQEAGDEGFVRVIMQDLTLTQKINATEGGLISLPSGASVNLKANSIIDNNGSAYSGEVSVYAYWYNPLGDKLAEEMPGDLRGTDIDGVRVQLGTYGMMAVELRDANGQELNIAEGQTATLTMPIPQGLQIAAPETLPIWSYDEERGYWRQEEGQATVQGENYVAEVPHFSFWNYDAPFPIIRFCAVFVDINGLPLINAKVTIRISETCIAKSGWTDAKGKVGGDIPKGELLDIYIKDECGGELYFDQIGPFDEDVDLGEITITIPEDNNTKVTGILTCDGLPVANGYALLTTNDGARFFAPTDENGRYEKNIILCGVSKISVQGYDLDTPAEGEVVITSDPSNPLIVDQDVCGGNSIEEYIIYEVNGQELILTNPSAEIVNGCLRLYADGVNEAFINIESCNPTEGANTAKSVIATIAGTLFQCREGVTSTGNSIPCDNFTLTITELGGIGEFITGTFEDTSNDPNISEINGSFKIYLDDIKEFSTLGGQVWLDANGNGIFDENQEEIFSRDLEMTVSLYDNNDVFITQVKTDPELGGYYFSPLDAGDYYIIAEAPIGYEFLPLGQDNVIDPTTSRSALISINGEKLDAHIGLLESTTVICETELIRGENSCNSLPGQVRINISSQDSLGVIVIDNAGVEVDNAFISSWSPYIFTGPADFDYQYRIVDADGITICDGKFDIPVEDMAAGICNLWPFYDCDNGQVVGGVEIECENLDFSSMITYEWSNGSTDPLLYTNTEGFYTITATDGAGCTAVGDVQIDFSEYRRISGFVWEDNPMFNDGVYDRNEEEMVSDVTINLYEANGTTPIQTTVTALSGDFEGAYSFDGLASGSYFVEIVLPMGYSYVAKDVGTSEYNDSEVDPSTGYTDLIVVGGCDYNSDINIGIKQ